MRPSWWTRRMRYFAPRIFWPCIRCDIDYGPGRHGITRGTTIYFFDPSGNRLETFGGYSAYQMDPDSRPVTWTQDQIAQAVFYYAQELNETFLSVYT